MFNGVAGHFFVDTAGLQFNFIIEQKFSHGEAVFNRRQISIFGKTVLVFGQKPDLVKIGD